MERETTLIDMDKRNPDGCQCSSKQSWLSGKREGNCEESEPRRRHFECPDVRDTDHSAKRDNLGAVGAGNYHRAGPYLGCSTRETVRFASFSGSDRSQLNRPHRSGERKSEYSSCGGKQSESPYDFF